MATQARLFKIGKREATRAWRDATAVVDQLEQTEAQQAAALRATREALKVARVNHREAATVLGDVLDSEDPTIPGVIDAPRTLPGEA